MIKKTVYTILACTGLSSLSYGQDIIIIDVPLIAHLDGSPMLRVENVIAFYDTMVMFYEHQYKMKPHDMCLHELVVLEQEGKLPAEFCQKILRVITKKLLELAQPHLKDLRRVKTILEEIIAQWAKQRGRNDSPLLLWSTIDGAHEAEFFQENVKRLSDINIFQQDLIQFIHDFIHSCPKSYNRYLESKRTAR